SKRDWSSDVCSSDLPTGAGGGQPTAAGEVPGRGPGAGDPTGGAAEGPGPGGGRGGAAAPHRRRGAGGVCAPGGRGGRRAAHLWQIGRASCRGRGLIS